MKCGFCGKSFDEKASAATCSGCPMSGSCGKICCPHCGFETPRTPRLSGISRLIKWLSGRRDCQNCQSPCSLANLEPGGKAEVLSVDTTDRRRLKRLIALGVLPGATVEITQTYPAYVFRSGHTVVAMDEMTARGIKVKPLAPGAD